MSTLFLPTGDPVTFDFAPDELQHGVAEFWVDDDERNNAVAIAWLESGWNAFAVADTTRPDAPCGTIIRVQGDLHITAERSVGWFQINSCNFPGWEWQRLYNTRHNCGTAHMLWQIAGGWKPWYFSATKLNLL